MDVNLHPICLDNTQVWDSNKGKITSLSIANKLMKSIFSHFERSMRWDDQYDGIYYPGCKSKHKNAYSEAIILTTGNDKLTLLASGVSFKHYILSSLAAKI